MAKVKQKYPKPFEKWYAGLPWWRKILHWLAVLASALATIAMFLGFLYLVLIVFGLYGFILKFRDMVLLDFAHWLFG